MGESCFLLKKNQTNSMVVTFNNNNIYLCDDLTTVFVSVMIEQLFRFIMFLVCPSRGTDVLTVVSCNEYLKQFVTNNVPDDILFSLPKNKYR